MADAIVPKKKHPGKKKGATDLRPRHSGGPSQRVTDEVCKSLRRGLPKEVACVMGGISADTMKNWLIKARDPDEPADSEYKKFAEAIALVESEQIGMCSAVVVKTMTDPDADPRLKFDAAKWFLEHRFSKHFSKQTRTEISGPDGEAIKVENKGLESLSTEELLRLAAGSKSTDEK